MGNTTACGRTTPASSSGEHPCSQCNRPTIFEVCTPCSRLSWALHIAPAIAVKIVRGPLRPSGRMRADCSDPETLSVDAFIRRNGAW